MPFQDIDEVTTPEPERRPGTLEKLVYKLFVEDWSLKLLSLAITLVLWLLVTGQNEPVTAHVSVQLNFIRPQAFEISNDPPKTVDVLLTGSRSKLDNLSSLDFVATVDISDQKAGERVIRLTDKAQIALPQGVRIDGFQPSSIPIRLEQLVERQVTVEAKVEGKVAEGFEVYAVRLAKGSVNVRGPASRVNALEKAQTETIWLNGQRETFTQQNVAIDVSDPKVDLLEPVIGVEVVVGPKRGERTFANVSAMASDGNKVQPAVGTVIVTGPIGDLEKLKESDIQIVVDPDPNQPPTLKLSDRAPKTIVLKSIQPSKFTKVD
jgi:YbbR domain-containing protein